MLCAFVPLCEPLFRGEREAPGGEVPVPRCTRARSFGYTAFVMNIVETILLENIDKPNALFVFPTDIAASRWADHLLRLRSQGGGGGENGGESSNSSLRSSTIAMNKFIAWDTFKQNSIRSKVHDKKSIPSALRKIFASRLIAENAQRCSKGDAPFFSSLIKPIWAGQAAHFADWITELLPQLGMWFKKRTGLETSCVQSEEAALLAKNFDSDDADLYALTLRYAQFLESFGLFEPAWEDPPFDDNGKECFIFFPQILFDYERYAHLLNSNKSVKIVKAEGGGAGGIAGASGESGITFFYTNSRSEITEAALYIRALHEQKNIPWDAIVVSIPDSKNYEPYMLRELANRNIPFVKRVGKALSEYPAGKFFAGIADCAAHDFAFSALSSLVLNSNLPWKDTEDIKKLIDFGVKNNCVSSWKEEENGKKYAVNTWEDAFAQPFGSVDPDARRFFGDLKNKVLALRASPSFSQLRNRYFSFRDRFFDMEKVTEETDITLSRCISELVALCELEKKFPGVSAPDPFMFFADYLGEINYLAQQRSRGVTILPYRTAASAPFDYHITLDSSQESLSIVFSDLGFLTKPKREKLGVADKDVSSAFIDVHRFNALKNAVFFCSEQTFAGFAIPHSKFGVSSPPKTRYAQEERYAKMFAQDLYLSEGALLSSPNGGERGRPATLYQNQKTGFDEWFSRRGRGAAGGAAGGGTSGGNWSARTDTEENIVKFIRDKYAKNPQYYGKYSVSDSSLGYYHNCSLQWLFRRVFEIENLDVEASLMAKNIIGLVYHALLNLFFSELKKSGEILAMPEYRGAGKPAGLPPAYSRLLSLCTNSLFNAFPSFSPHPEKTVPGMSALTMRFLRAEKTHIQFRLEKFLAVFLSFFYGCRVVGSENSYICQRDSYFINGKIDCILEDTREESDGCGKLIIVDFKTEKMPKLADCIGGKNDLSNFQLPMYISLAEESEKKEVYAALFFSIHELKPQIVFGTLSKVVFALQKEFAPTWSSEIIPDEKKRILRNSGHFESLMEEFSQKTAMFANEIKTANFSVFETEFDKCSKCDYQSICRTTYKISLQEIPIQGSP